MTRTPDEIKKGLECLTKDNAPDAECEGCPYFEELGYLHWSCHRGKIWADAFILIQQLQEDNAQQARCIENMTDKLNAMNDEAAKLQAERDAAAEVIKELAWDCDDGCKKYCKHYISDCGKGICPAYIEGVGDDESKYPYLRWTCQDFAVCPREKGTPCEGCIGHHYANFEWRGVQKEE